MELEEMKNIWKNEPLKKEFVLNNISEKTAFKLNKQTNIFQISEVVGLSVAYILAGVILYHFSEFTQWYLRISGLILLAYFLIMPLYTLAITRKMRKPDLMRSNYKEVLEHFYVTQRKLKRAEKITFMANPFLFVSATILLTKIYAHIDLFSLKFGWPVVVFMIAAFIGATLFNTWAFKKREQQLLSVTQLLEQEN